MLWKAKTWTPFSDEYLEGITHIYFNLDSLRNGLKNQRCIIFNCFNENKFKIESYEDWEIAINEFCFIWRMMSRKERLNCKTFYLATDEGDIILRTK